MSQLKFFRGFGMVMTDNINVARWPGYHLDPYNSPKWNLGGLSALYELKMAIIASKSVKAASQIISCTGPIPILQLLHLCVWL